jgi:hypothetical protein
VPPWKSGWGQKAEGRPDDAGEVKFLDGRIKELAASLAMVGTAVPEVVAAIAELEGKRTAATKAHRGGGPATGGAYRSGDPGAIDPAAVNHGRRAPGLALAHPAEVGGPDPAYRGGRGGQAGVPYHPFRGGACFHPTAASGSKTLTGSAKANPLETAARPSHLRQAASGGRQAAVLHGQACRPASGPVAQF